jgi:hypothetical protein
LLKERIFKLLAMCVILLQPIASAELPANIVNGHPRKYRLFQTVKAIDLARSTKMGVLFRIPKGAILLSPVSAAGPKKNPKYIETVLGNFKNEDLQPVNLLYSADEYHIPDKFCTIDIENAKYSCQSNFPSENERPTEYSLTSLQYFIDESGDCEPKDFEIRVHRDFQRLKRLESGGPKHHSVYIYIEKKTKQVIQIYSSVSGWECH